MEALIKGYKIRFNWQYATEKRKILYIYMYRHVYKLYMHMEAMRVRYI